MYTISVEDKFSSAHQLRGYKGKCENLHGHNWKVILSVAGNVLDECGMLIDFHELKIILKGVLANLDHTNINEFGIFKKINPTTENLAKYIFEEVGKCLIEKNITNAKVHKVTVYESEGSSCEYINE